MKSTLVLAFACAAVAGGWAQTSAKMEPMLWRFEDARRVGDQALVVLGTPRPVDEAGVKALRFNGTSDGLIIAQNPLEGRKAFTVEIRFKPDGDGPAAQRFLHAEDTAENRALIELRIAEGSHWYLDTFLYAKAADKGGTLADKTKLHACDRWYWAALVYDGKTMSHFIDGAKELEGAMDFGPMKEGRTSVGVRLNQVFWFKGAIAEVRFHPRALTATELQQAK
jgi:hypothetical protein